MLLADLFGATANGGASIHASYSPRAVVIYRGSGEKAETGLDGRINMIVACLVERVEILILNGPEADAWVEPGALERLPKRGLQLYDVEIPTLQQVVKATRRSDEFLRESLFVTTEETLINELVQNGFAVIDLSNVSCFNC